LNRYNNGAAMQTQNLPPIPNGSLLNNIPKVSQSLAAKFSIADLITWIRHDLVAARNHFEVYRTYMLKETREKYRGVLAVSAYATFFKLDLAAHFSAMMVTLGRVFDENPKNIGIPALVQAAPRLAQIAIEQQNRAWELWRSRKIMLLRHQVVAHRSSRTNVADTFKRVGTSLNELNELIGTSEQLLETWSREEDCHVIMPTNLKNELTYLLETLHRVRLGQGWK
jgi:AbiU2